MTCANGCDHNWEDCLCGCDECQMESSGMCWREYCLGECGLDHGGDDEE